MQTAVIIYFAFVWFLRQSVILVHNIRHGGASATMNSLFISWKSHPSMVLIEPPSLPDPPTKGCCDWTEVSLSSHVSLPFQKAILKPHISRSLFQGLGVWLLWLPRFYTSRVINVFLMLYIQFSSFLKEIIIPFACIGGKVVDLIPPEISFF